MQSIDRDISLNHSMSSTQWIDSIYRLSRFVSAQSLEALIHEVTEKLDKESDIVIPWMPDQHSPSGKPRPCFDRGEKLFLWIIALTLSLKSISLPNHIFIQLSIPSHDIPTLNRSFSISSNGASPLPIGIWKTIKFSRMSAPFRKKSACSTMAMVGILWKRAQMIRKSSQPFRFMDSTMFIS